MQIERRSIGGDGGRMIKKSIEGSIDMEMKSRMRKIRNGGEEDGIASIKVKLKMGMKIMMMVKDEEDIGEEGTGINLKGKNIDISIEGIGIKERIHMIKMMMMKHDESVEKIESIKGDIDMKMTIIGDIEKKTRDLKLMTISKSFFSRISEKGI